ncbi:MAG: hypothetical protein QNJ22_14800 [Desulfosarcinaceae bacterium]|nr:hypothetical protein [Desulfosarcinaceae bacterium]
MPNVYDRLRERARAIIATCEAPAFYTDCRAACTASRQMFDTDPIISRLKAYIHRHVDEDFGHGWQHLTKVTLDAGALVHIEGKNAGYHPAYLERRMLLAQCAGLLHDFKRKEKEHARAGERHARDLLQAYPFQRMEIEDVSLAIRNHEAFKTPVPAASACGSLLSDCLYDADKFRWGPDNFADTVWEMVAYHQPSLEQFVTRYPKGMAGIERIKTTFRTHTGRHYGPQFIDLGLTIGRELLAIIETEYL